MVSCCRSLVDLSSLLYRVHLKKKKEIVGKKETGRGQVGSKYTSLNILVKGMNTFV